jgi:branched-subunit amino acid aminotransferase/4-amino-4-deoxychorismate lyase
MTPDVIIDGRLVAASAAAVPVGDVGLQRGYGCFETVRAYAGAPFRLPEHLDRLGASAAALGIQAPDRATVGAWALDRAHAGGDCAVRIIVTGGGAGGRPGEGGSTIVMVEPLGPLPEQFRILPVAAPWHADGVPSELTGAKTLSYAPNLAASLAAQRAGFDDALLVGAGGSVLEGPTYSVGWVDSGTLFTPSLELGILSSITRAAVVELATEIGIDVEEGGFPLDAMTDAEEPFAMSTNKEVLPIAEIGQVRCSTGPVVAKLGAAFAELVRRETGALRGRGGRVTW